MPTQTEAQPVPLVKIRRAAQITLPSEVREQLNLREGDYLEAEVTGGGVFLRPVARVDRAKAWEQVFAAMERVRYIGPEPQPSDEEVLEMASKAVHEYRKTQHEGGA